MQTFLSLMLMLFEICAQEFRSGSRFGLKTNIRKQKFRFPIQPDSPTRNFTIGNVTDLTGSQFYRKISRESDSSACSQYGSQSTCVRAVRDEYACIVFHSSSGALNVNVNW